MDDTKVQIALAIIGSGILTTILNRIFAISDRKREKDTAQAVGLRTLLRVQIRSLGKKYISDGCIDNDDLDDIAELWKVYHDDLGGNGYLDTIMQRVKALPINV